MNKADQMINRIHNLNLIISKEEKAVHLRASHLHFIKNNYIPTDQDLHHAALTANTSLDFLSMHRTVGGQEVGAEPAGGLTAPSEVGKKGKRTPPSATVLTEPSIQKGIEELRKCFRTLLG